MTESAFAYVTFIRAAPEAIWKALTNEAFARRYWFGYGPISNWEKGAKFQLAGESGVVVEGEILESNPYETLSYSWRPQFDEEMKAEPISRVTFTLEPRQGAVKLTVLHEGFPPGSKVLPDISTGWPAVLSNLKSILETGEPLNIKACELPEATAA
jgi:uncharacterized protein YndB with AHSA1/START domain